MNVIQQYHPESPGTADTQVKRMSGKDEKRNLGVYEFSHCTVSYYFWGSPSDSVVVELDSFPGLRIGL